MSHRLILLLLSIPWITIANAAPLDGTWKVVWPCEGATDFYAERCAAGYRDYFSLQLWSAGDRLCGVRSATAKLGNIVDEDDPTGNPTIIGKITRGVATVSLDGGTDGSGAAEIRVHGNKLYWKLTRPVQGAWWLPAHATLLRQAGILKSHAAACGKPAG